MMIKFFFKIIFKFNSTHIISRKDSNAYIRLVRMAQKWHTKSQLIDQRTYLPNGLA